MSFDDAEVKQAAAELLSAGSMARSEKDEAWLLELLSDTDGGVRLGGIKAIEEMRLPQAKDRLAKMAIDTARSESERAAAVKALRILDAARGPKSDK